MVEVDVDSFKQWLGSASLALTLLMSVGCAGDTAAECSCEAMTCGINACGESCGTCGDNALCWNDQCVEQASSGLSCDITNFTLDGESVIRPFTAGSYRMVYTATGPDPDGPQAEDGRPLAMQKLILEINPSKFFADGAPQTGTFALGGDDAKDDCALCVRGGTFCNKQGCGKDFVVETGTLEITDAGEPGGQFAGRLSGVILKQVNTLSVDPNTSAYGELTSPDSWCLGNFQFAVDVPEVVETENNCIADGTGRLIGDNIADFTLMNCNGDEVSIHDYCGSTKKALWLIAASGW